MEFSLLLTEIQMNKRSFAVLALGIASVSGTGHAKIIGETDRRLSDSAPDLLPAF